MTTAITETPVAEQKFVRGLGLLDSTMLVAGSMIGSGIFIVSSIIARQVGSPGWLLVVWIVTGLLTLLDAVPCYSDRHDRCGRGRVRPLHRRAPSLGFRKQLSNRADSFRRLRSVP